MTLRFVGFLCSVNTENREVVWWLDGLSWHLGSELCFSQREDVAVPYVSLQSDPHPNGQCSTSSWFKWFYSVLWLLLSFGQQASQHLGTYFCCVTRPWTRAKSSKRYLSSQKFMCMTFSPHWQLRLWCGSIIDWNHFAPYWASFIGCHPAFTVPPSIFSEGTALPVSFLVYWCYFSFFSYVDHLKVLQSDWVWR